MSLLGLVPMRVDPHKRVVTLGRAVPGDFTEPFFEYTCRRLIEEDPSRVQTVSWDELFAEAETWPAVPDPAGLLFNVGRCGSTLLANMLKAHPELWVLSEPEPLSKPEAVSRRSPDLDSRIATDKLYAALYTLLAYAANLQGQRLVVKYPSWLAARAPVIAARHPESPVFALYRNPHAVIASCIAKPPLFAEGIHHPAALHMAMTPALGSIGDRPLTGATYHAGIWVSTMVGSMAVDQERLMILSYEQLKADAVACLRPVLEHVGVEITDQVLADGAAVTTVYAKPKTGEEAVTFDPSGAHSRRDLSPRTLDEIDRVIGDVPSQLLAHPSHLTLPSNPTDTGSPTTGPPTTGPPTTGATTP